jgi:PIN domain nuclease of toxin-antitoxin system
VRLLIDTRAFLWWVGDSRELSRRARAAIGNGRNECLVSIASGWEIAIKVSLGELRIEGSLDRFLPEQIAANGFRPLPIDLKHAARVAALPFHHREPFDRLLAAQALEEDLALVTADPVFAKYGIRRVW